MNNPGVVILMTIYKPNKVWLEKQLNSLNEQTYNNLYLIVRNDCPEDVFDYQKFIANYITKFKFEFYQGEVNLGSTKSFERLTYIALAKLSFKYISFCDQDDIWLREKIQYFVNFAEINQQDLLCGNMYIIDADDNMVYNSFNESRYIDMQEYKGRVWPMFLFVNFVTGSTILVNRELAVKALPYSNYCFYDYWLGLFAAGNNYKFKYIQEKFVKHRIHDHNDSNINNKKDTTVQREVLKNFMFWEDVLCRIPKLMHKKECYDVFFKREEILNELIARYLECKEFFLKDYLNSDGVKIHFKDFISLNNYN